MLLKPKSSANKNTTLGISFSDDLLELPANPEVEEDDDDEEDEDGATAVGADFVGRFVGEVLGPFPEDGATAVGADFVGRFVGEVLGPFPEPTAGFCCGCCDAAKLEILDERIVVCSFRELFAIQKPHTARDKVANTRESTGRFTRATWPSSQSSPAAVGLLRFVPLAGAPPSKSAAIGLPSGERSLTSRATQRRLLRLQASQSVIFVYKIIFFQFC